MKYSQEQERLILSYSNAIDEFEKAMLRLDLCRDNCRKNGILTDEINENKKAMDILNKHFFELDKR